MTVDGGIKIVERCWMRKLHERWTQAQAQAQAQARSHAQTEQHCSDLFIDLLCVCRVSWSGLLSILDCGVIKAERKRSVCDERVGSSPGCGEDNH
jgi:hypothetical protein